MHQKRISSAFAPEYEPVFLPPTLLGNKRETTPGTLYLWRIVDKVSTYGRKQERVLLVEEDRLMLCNMDGDITRIARLSDIEACARQVTKKGLEQICIKFYAELGEPSLLLQLREDKQNVEMPDVLEMIDHFRQQARHGEELTVCLLPPQVDIKNNRGLDFGPWSKTKSWYKTPAAKLREKRFLYVGSVFPP